MAIFCSFPPASIRLGFQREHSTSHCAICLFTPIKFKHMGEDRHLKGNNCFYELACFIF